MAEFPALPLWTDAFVADTLHLSGEEIGVYLLLLFTAWRRPDCDLPDDDKFLAMVARCDGRKWRHLRPVMERFHVVANGVWTQKRLQKERKYVDDLSRKMRGNANSRWNKNKGLTDADALQSQSNGNAPIPIPIPIPIQEEERNQVVDAHSAKALRAPVKRGTSLHGDFPGMFEYERAQEYWREKGRPDLATRVLEIADGFRDHHLAKGTTSKDWAASWRTWCRNALKFERAGNGNGRQASAHDNFDLGAIRAIQQIEARAAEARAAEGEHFGGAASPAQRALPPPERDAGTDDDTAAGDGG